MNRQKIHMTETVNKERKSELGKLQTFTANNSNNTQNRT